MNKWLLMASLLSANLWIADLDSRVATTLPYPPASGAHMTFSVELVATAPLPAAVLVTPKMVPFLTATEAAALADDISDWLPVPPLP